MLVTSTCINSSVFFSNLNVKTFDLDFVTLLFDCNIQGSANLSLANLIMI